MQRSKTIVINAINPVGIISLRKDVFQRKVRGHDMRNKVKVPIWKKTNLTVDEASAYSGIGTKKLRKMTESEDCPYVLWNGTKRLIKREQLDEYLENLSSI